MDPDKTWETTARPAVSIIVPARNEEASLAACLQSLLAQNEVAREIIVVDDGSTDGTRDIAAGLAGVRLVLAKPLAPGWTGKANACTTGAELAQADWLLFTDADTIHLPGSLARALAEARQHGAGLLSYSPAQEVHGLAQHALMPLVFAELARAYPPPEVSAPASCAAAANGQYMLFTREAYEAVGGHAAVAADLLEDVALARAVKRSGRRLFFRFGGDAVRTRMYRDFAQMREGWTKNLVLLFPQATALARRRLLEFAGIFSAGAAALMFAWRGWDYFAMGAALAALGTLLHVWGRARRAHFGRLSLLLAPLGLPLFAWLLVRSHRAHQQGSVSWKGRVITNCQLPTKGDPWSI
jgi:glycosyltransferase involved in cell wall biosynthesis